MAGDVPPPLLFLGGAAVGAALAANALGRRMRRRLRALARAAPRVRVGLEVRENDNDPWRVEPSPDEPSLSLTPDPNSPPRARRWLPRTAGASSAASASAF